MNVRRQHNLELGGALAAYTVVLFASLRALDHLPDGPLRIAVALAPMIPAMAVPFVTLRHLRRIDELQRQIQLEALGFAFAGTAVVTFGYGFLELVGFPRPSSFVIWPIMAGFWILGTVISGRRFR